VPSSLILRNRHASASCLGLPNSRALIASMRAIAATVSMQQAIVNSAQVAGRIRISVRPIKATLIIASPARSDRMRGCSVPSHT
jgi:hypothetical protein